MDDDGDASLARREVDGRRDIPAEADDDLRVGPGDRVAAYARKQVVSGGTFAEYVTVRVDDVAAVPDEVTDDVAAALPLAGLTALVSSRRWP